MIRYENQDWRNNQASIDFGECELVLNEDVQKRFIKLIRNCSTEINNFIDDEKEDLKYLDSKVKSKEDYS